LATVLLHGRRYLTVQALSELFTEALPLLQTLLALTLGLRVGSAHLFACGRPVVVAVAVELALLDRRLEPAAVVVLVADILRVGLLPTM
jgi:hypothetical protein